MHLQEDFSFASTESHVLKITQVWTIMKTHNNPVERSLKEQHSNSHLIEMLDLMALSSKAWVLAGSVE